MDSQTKPNVTRKTRTYSELKRHVTHQEKDIVERLNPPRSVNLVVGETGEGKTPWEMQKAICVAAGIPFLGQQVQQGAVVWVDFENGELLVLGMMEKIATALGLENVPENIHILSFPGSVPEVDEQVALIKPKLVIVDALRGFDSDAEQYNSKAGKLLKERYQKARQTNASWDFIHHLKKHNEDDQPEPLVTAPILQWLTQASGARALINQTAVRTGVQNFTGANGVELVVRGHCRVVGEFGPWYIGRIYADDSDEPIGYERLTGAHLLQQGERDLFLKLPPEFTHKELVKQSEKPKGKAQADFVRRCLSFGLLKKTGEWKSVVYKKTEVGLAATAAPAPPSPSDVIKALVESWKPEQKYSLPQVQGQFKNRGLKSHSNHVQAALSHAEREKWVDSNGPYTGSTQLWWKPAGVQVQEGSQVIQ